MHSTVYAKRECVSLCTSVYFQLECVISRFWIKFDVLCCEHFIACINTADLCFSERHVLKMFIHALCWLSPDRIYSTFLTALCPRLVIDWCWGLNCLFCGLSSLDFDLLCFVSIHTLPQWLGFPQLLHIVPYAGHWSRVSFWWLPPQLWHFLIGNVLIALTFVPCASANCFIWAIEASNVLPRFKACSVVKSWAVLNSSFLQFHVYYSGNKLLQHTFVWLPVIAKVALFVLAISVLWWSRLLTHNLAVCNLECINERHENCV